MRRTQIHLESRRRPRHFGARARIGLRGAGRVRFDAVSNMEHRPPNAVARRKRRQLAQVAIGRRRLWNRIYYGSWMPVPLTARRLLRSPILVGFGRVLAHGACARTHPNGDGNGASINPPDLRQKQDISFFRSARCEYEVYDRATTTNYAAIDWGAAPQHIPNRDLVVTLLVPPMRLLSQ